MDLVGSIMNRNKKVHVKIVSYVAGDKTLAKRRAESVKMYIIRKFPDVNSERLMVNGFGKPEKVGAGGKRFDLDDSINFTTIQK